MDNFYIVTNGELVRGFNKEETRKKLALLCKYDAETLYQLFSGFPFTFKTGLDDAAARRYKTALDRTGIDCRIEKVVPEIKIEIDAHGSHAISHHPRDEQALKMICPKCGVQQAKRLTCNSCDIVIEKFSRQQQSAAQTMSEVPQQSGSAEKSSFFLWFTVVVMLGTGGYFAYNYIIK